MAETQYRNSRGEWVDIADMPFPHLKNAAEKLRREGSQPAALETMDARLKVLEANFRADLEAQVNNPGLTEAERQDARTKLAKLETGQ